MNLKVNRNKVFKGAYLVSILALMGLGQTNASDKAAFVYIGPAGEYGWSYSHNQGRIAAEKALKGKYAFGWNSDMSKYGPKAHLAASVLHWDKIYTPVMQQVANKTWKSGSVWYGVREGAVNIEGFGSAVTPQEKAKVLAIRDSIRSGKHTAFTGPIYKQDGTLLIEKGKHLTDKELMTMNYYVKGVDGVYPK